MTRWSDFGCRKNSSRKWTRRGKKRWRKLKPSAKKGTNEKSLKLTIASRPCNDSGSQCKLHRLPSTLTWGHLWYLRPSLESTPNVMGAFFAASPGHHESLVGKLLYVGGQHFWAMLKVLCSWTLNVGVINTVLQGCYVGGNGSCAVRRWRHSRGFLAQEITTSGQPERRPSHEWMFTVLHQGGNHQVFTSFSEICAFIPKQWRCLQWTPLFAIAFTVHRYLWLVDMFQPKDSLSE